MKATMMNTGSSKLAMAIAAVGLALGASVSQAATYTWFGSGANGLWSTGTNWRPVTSGTGLPTTGTHSVVYNTSGTARLSGTTNGSYNLSSVSFESGAPAYTIRGNGTSVWNLSGPITNNSSTVQTIGGTTNGTRLTLNYGTASGTFALDAAQASGTLSVIANLSGNTGTVVQKTGPGTLVFEKPNLDQTFNGTLELLSGTTVMKTGFSSAQVVTGTGAYISMNPTSASFSLSTLVNSGSASIDGNVAVTGDTTLSDDGTLLWTLPTDPTATNIMQLNGSVALGGQVYSKFDSTYPDASWDNQYVFNMFDYDPTAVTGNFDGFTVNYDGIDYAFTSGVEGGVTYWYSPPLPDGRFMLFSEASGELVVVPEPSTMVFAAIGAAVSGWHVLNKRRSRKVVA